MRKIPTLFVRDPEDRKHVTREVTAGCEWVIEGEGRPTFKFDGTCVLIRDGEVFARREVKLGKHDPADFELSEEDATTGKRFGWVPVDEDPQWRWHLEGRANTEEADGVLEDGTYELVGPKVQGNPGGHDDHQLVRHGVGGPTADPRTYDELRTLLMSDAFGEEGVVWHHDDGRMVKLKVRDFA